MHTNSSKRHTGGFTLIELIVFIMIVSVAVAGILSVITVSSKSSTDPVRVRQANILAQNILENIRAHPMRQCDPGASDPARCPGRRPIVPATLVPAQGPPTSLKPLYVEDFSQLPPSPIKDSFGHEIAGLSEYRYTVTLTPDGDVFGLPLNAAVRIAVLVSYSGGRVTLEGYRLRYPSES